MFCPSYQLPLQFPHRMVIKVQLYPLLLDYYYHPVLFCHDTSLYKYRSDCRGVWYTQELQKPNKNLKGRKLKRSECTNFLCNTKKNPLSGVGKKISQVHKNMWLRNHSPMTWHPTPHFKQIQIVNRDHASKDFPHPSQTHIPMSEKKI